MPSVHLARLSINKEAKVRCYTVVREDAIILFGFLEQEYYDLFIMLISVSGVGPKVALGILSAVKPDDFYTAVRARELKSLMNLPGIGKKTAERLLLELKDKIGDDITELGVAQTSDGSFEPGNAAGEAIEALRSLGYTNAEIVPILKQIDNCSELSGEEIIRRALKAFAGRK